MELENSRVTVVGLGLMGGSLSLDLLGRCKQLLGVDTDPRAIRFARRAGITTADLDSALDECDVLVLATPARETLRLIEQFRAHPPALELLMDLASTKRQIVEKMDTLPNGIAAIGGHPLCGKERSGFQEAEVGLFLGSIFILSPSARTTPSSLALAERIITEIGARPRHMDAAQHDRLLAAVSHLPYLLAVTLVGVAQDFGDTDPALWDLIASGFMGTSRLAASDLTMMVDILATNQDMTLAALSRAQARLGQLEGLVAAGDRQMIRDYLEPLQQRRASLDPHRELAHGA